MKVMTITNVLMSVGGAALGDTGDERPVQGRYHSHHMHCMVLLVALVSMKSNGVHHYLTTLLHFGEEGPKCHGFC